MTETYKGASFSAEPMDAKPVTKLPGVGPALGKRLADKGFAEAWKVYKQLELLKFNKADFQTWMLNTCNAHARHSADCYEALNKWRQQFDSGQDAQAPSTSSSSANPRTPGRKRRISTAAAPKSVKFNKRTPANTPVQTSEMDSDPISSYFLSALRTVKSFPIALQFKVKEQLFGIMLNAEKENYSAANSSQNGAVAGILVNNHDSHT